MWKYVVFGLLCSMPIIVVYTLRYGIGYDYAAYEKYYDIVNNVPIFEYFRKHFEGVGIYYAEIGYYLLNKFSINFIVLKFIVIVFINIFLMITAIKSRLHCGMLFFIFFCLNLAAAMNIVRFSMALSLLLYGYIYLVANKASKYLLCTLIAALFHKSMLFCLPFVLLKEFKSHKFSVMRDVVLLVAVLGWPVIAPYLFSFADSLPILTRYFSIGAYKFNTNTMQHSYKLLLHIFVVLFPFVVIFRKKMLYDSQTRVMLRIFILEFPFRMLAFYNEWYSRLVRIPQLIEVLMVPFLLSKVQNPQTKLLLTLYYCIWYIFCFIYSVYYSGYGGIIPYQCELFR
ncbi:EpsG family protein [Cloacibacillus sp. An23]|uniref:EpsG family protein n=1 Tax=Cloacibacillus sp. An23 TaxID=1965591 RepID=UPI0021016531|nr:EpsG family protein [Cloacibacillus sp. An23]